MQRTRPFPPAVLLATALALPLGACVSGDGGGGAPVADGGSGADAVSSRDAQTGGDGMVGPGGDARVVDAWIGPSGDAHVGPGDTWVPPARDAFVGPDTDAVTPPPRDAAAPTPDVPVGPADRFQAQEERACDTTVRFAAPAGTGRVQLAGDFTGWADHPLDMQAGGDGSFSLTVGAAQGVSPGGTYAYKLIVDGQWRLDPGQVRQKYDGNCVNSAFQVPDCAAGPEVEIASVDGVFRAVPRAAAGGSHDLQVWFSLDSAPFSPFCQAGSCGADLGDLAPGKHVMTARATDADGKTSEPVSAPFWVAEPGAAPFEWRDATLYMMLLDRFANGAHNNDAPVQGVVPYPNDWHGGDLNGALSVLQSGYFEQLGINAIWLSPVNQQADGAWPGTNDPSQMFAGYHGYWPIRGRDVEPRFGGGDALRDFVAEAHRHGIRVLLDLINNQVHQDHAYYHDHPEWFRTACVCGTDGCGWSERPLDCLFAPYLPDINWRVPDAEHQFVSDALSWIADYDIDGFRVDAVKHVETTAIYNLRAALDARFSGHAQGAARLVMLGETAVGEGDHTDDGCGEHYGDGYQWISAYTSPNGLDGQFDFPSHHRMQWGLLTDTLGYNDLETIVRDMQTRYSADATHVRFLGSHDSNRVASRAAQDPAMDCRSRGAPPCDTLAGVSGDPRTYARLRRAFTVLYALPGIPLLYNGDELAIPGGNDPDNRRDMEFEGALSNVAMSVTVPTADQRAFSLFMQALGRARQSLPAIRRGVRDTLVAEPDLWAVAFRMPSGEKALVVVNRGAAVAGRALGLGAGWVSQDAIVGAGHLTADGNGVRLDVPAGEVAIFGTPQ